MANIIALIIVAAIVGSAIYYIVKKKKSGAHCIGCPNSGSCNCSCSSKK